MNKHAYLIMAHKDDFTLHSLLEMLDDDRNDIYLHIDIKNHDFCIDNINKNIRKARIYYTQRTDVRWGGYSQINAELILLKKAMSTYQYSRLHLISGEDLPIKTQDYIHEFFNRFSTMEFVQFTKNIFDEYDRVRLYHLFQEIMPRKKLFFQRFGNKLFLVMQKCCGIKRNRDVKFQKGATWFSITGDFANYVIENEMWIKKVFRNTFCCDEVFVQTLIINSPFANSLYCSDFDSNKAIVREIDWNRGKPYVWRIGDYSKLCESSMCFARKFDCNIDREIIEKIHDHVLYNA